MDVLTRRLFPNSVGAMPRRHRRGRVGVYTCRDAVVRRRSIRYVQQCEHFRTDITTINLAMTTYGWWHAKRDLYPQVIFPGTHYARDPSKSSGYSIGQFFDANYERRTGGIFLGGTLSFPDTEYKERYEFVPYGLVSVLSRKERPPSLEAYVLESRQAWATALNVLGPETGFEVAQDEEIAAYFISRSQGDGAFTVRATPAFARYWPDAQEPWASE